MPFNGKKTVFLFPGQGAQYVGMAMDFVSKDADLAETLKAFDRDHNEHLFEIIAEGPEDKLKETRYTQPAILFHSIAAMRALQREIDITPDLVAGHSLGEFTALVANDVLTLPDAMHLVHRRGEFMIRANEGRPFAMSAILGLDPEKIREICLTASQVGLVVAANFNTQVQTVISGTLEGVTEAGRLAEEAGAGKVVPLAVGGPFHSPLIEKAGIWLGEEIARIHFSPTHIPVVSNVDAQPATDVDVIKDKLVRQVTSSVLWLDSVKHMIDNGVELFIEFGPQKVLAGMMKKIDRKARVISIDRWEDLAPAVAELQQSE